MELECVQQLGGFERDGVELDVTRAAGDREPALVCLPKGLDTLPFGFDNVKRSLEIASQYAHEQGVIPSAFKAEQLFEPSTQGLGS